MRLDSFRAIRPRYEAPQEEILAWLTDMHTRAARASRCDGRSFDDAEFQARMARLVRHVCCGSDKIATRGYSTAHDGRGSPDDSGLYDFARCPSGGGTAARMACFTREVESAFARLYDGVTEPPGDLVHVTCTGYESPSGAQRLVARKGWGQRTRVVHAYHMGCYAAVPALRVAIGLSRAPDGSYRAGRNTGDNDMGARGVDVVHTEFCSLHLDASVHTAEQLVVQSLFADGSIRYRVRDGEHGEGPGLRVLALHEVIDDDSAGAMQWRLGDSGMQMTLSRDVPDRLARAVRPFVGALYGRAGLDFAREGPVSVVAVHPGGPRIIDLVRDALELSEGQVAAARRVLRRFGNMSSATLPHIWTDLLDDPCLSAGRLVASLAFGPGLTVCGALFRKE